MGVVVWLIVMCVTGGVFYVSWEHDEPEGTIWYLGEDTQNVALALVKTSARYFLICYQFVPISLYVSMMFYQTICRAFVIADVQLYDSAQDEPCQVRQMALLDELGQVSHVFSDKTGTLTSNHMEFRRCYILSPDGSGREFGCGETAISQSLADRREAGAGGKGAVSAAAGGPLDGQRAIRTQVPKWAQCKAASATYCNYEEAADAPSIFEAIESGGPAGQRCRELMLALAVNHSVLLETVNGRQELSASSPDEQAFVAAAEYFGFDFVERDADRGLVHLQDKLSSPPRRYAIELLYAFPYESSRKRMSVIVKLPEDILPLVGGTERVRLYTKGADSVLCDLTTGVLDPDAPGADGANMQTLDQLLYAWADIALRTLVFAKRELPDFKRWSAEYEIAISDPENVRKAKLKEPNRISELQAEVESRLTLQGATAIEDKLQDGVPEILKDLRSAGIKVWMLTGDKVGTAKNIATACNILPADADALELTTETHPVLGELKTSTLLRVGKALQPARREAAAAAAAGGLCGRGGRARELAEDRLREAVAREVAALEAELPELATVRRELLERERAIEQRAARSGGGGGGGGEGTVGAELPQMCLILDEKAIEYCGLLCKSSLATVGYYSRSVVACRARKDQKAELLNLIKEGYPDSCCLAIGDGANDVAMIRQGHIGVGIIGKEGMQAVNNSDFAIGQFQMLRHLLFVHGRFAYRRTSLFCYYMFYKNVTNVLAMYFYTLAARASGERLFTQAYIEIYNIAFTSLPIILFCVFDQDVSKQEAASSPKGYTPGLLRLHYTHLGFVRWMLEAVLLACLCTYVPALGLGYPGWSLSSPANGDPGISSISMTAMTLVCVGVNLRLAIEMHSWSGLEHLLMWGSIASIELFALLVSFVWYPSSLPISYSWNALYAIVWHVWDDLSYWLVCVLVLSLILLPRFLGRAWELLFATDASTCSTRMSTPTVVAAEARFSEAGAATTTTTTAPSAAVGATSTMIQSDEEDSAIPSPPMLKARARNPSSLSSMPSEIMGSESSFNLSDPQGEASNSPPVRTPSTRRVRRSDTFSISEMANSLVLSRSSLTLSQRNSARLEPDSPAGADRV